MYRLIRPLLFLLPPERAHAFVLQCLDLYAHFAPRIQHASSSSIRLMNINFPSRIGLAAGFDKNGDHIPGLAALGFGFLEIGTVTPKPQSGQSLPRIFRLIEDRALINRMGFPNKGVDHLIERLEHLSHRPVLGINIGKNASTSLDDAIHDYVTCLQRVYAHADYIVVNLSSPNTPGLRELQGGRYLPGLLKGLKQEQATLADKTSRYVPLVVKIAPDLTEEELTNIAQMLLEAQVDGVIATNTTLSREGLHSSVQEAGGLSGQPLFQPSTRILTRLKAVVGQKMAVIGVGGVMNEEQAKAKFEAGADLVQLYTGLIYTGPGLIKRASNVANFPKYLRPL